MTSHNGQKDGRDRGLNWSTPTEAAGLILRGATVRTAVPIAAIVGTVLSLVNEGQVVASGHGGVATWLRIGVNYAIPFVVASIGYVAPFRNRDIPECGPSLGLESAVTPERQTPRTDSRRDPAT